MYKYTLNIFSLNFCYRTPPAPPLTTPGGGPVNVCWLLFVLGFCCCCCCCCCCWFTNPGGGPSFALNPGGATGGYHGSTQEEIASIIINDGTSDKTVWAIQLRSDQVYIGFDQNVDYTVFLPAGHSLKILSSSTAVRFIGSIRQIADLSGNLIDP